MPPVQPHLLDYWPFNAVADERSRDKTCPPTWACAVDDRHTLYTGLTTYRLYPLYSDRDTSLILPWLKAHKYLRGVRQIPTVDKLPAVCRVIFCDRPDFIAIVAQP